MLTSVVGVYRDGKIELREPPAGIKEAQVIVTFLPAAGQAGAGSGGMTEAEMANLRWRLQAFVEDWERPEMDVYDDM
jgi:hypothetical protein